MHRARGRLAATVGIAAVIGFAGAAWACTPSAEIASLSTRTALPGETVSVTVRSFHDGPVAIRWDSATGATLAVVQGPDGTGSVRVPQAAPGLYYLVATQAAAPSPAVAIEIEPAPAGGSQAPAQPAPQADVPAPSTDSAPHASGPADEQPVADVGPATPAAPTPAPDRAEAGRTAASSAGPVARAGGAGASGEAAPVAPVGPAAAAEADAVAPGPSARTAWDDPASGFAAGRDTRRAAGLSSPAGQDGGTSPLAVALLTAGVLTLAGGAVVGRRRVQAAAGSRHPAGDGA